MIIRVDKDARENIEGLCDLALKVGGLRNKPMVDILLNSMEDITEKSSGDKDDDKPND